MELHELHEKVRGFERNRTKSRGVPGFSVREVFHGTGICPRCGKYSGDIVEKGGGFAIRCPKCGDVAAIQGSAPKVTRPY